MARYIDADVLSKTLGTEMTRITREDESISKSARLSLMRWVTDRVYKSKTVDVVPTEFHDKCMQIEIEKRRNMVEVVRCRDCIHAKQHSYAPAECQWYCTASLQYHSDRFFCACGERRA